jgi:hypothetical protein
MKTSIRCLAIAVVLRLVFAAITASAQEPNLLYPESLARPNIINVMFVPNPDIDLDMVEIVRGDSPVELWRIEPDKKVKGTEVLVTLWWFSHDDRDIRWFVGWTYLSPKFVNFLRTGNQDL